MTQLKCAKCRQRFCQAIIEDESALPSFCPIRKSPGLVKDVSQRYQQEKIKNFYVKAALTEKGCYDEAEARDGRTLPLRPRIRELAEFAKTIGAKKIGLAFCNGLAEEAFRIVAIMEKHGIHVESVVCWVEQWIKRSTEFPQSIKLGGGINSKQPATRCFRLSS